jgi:hypothetical protein
MRKIDQLQTTDAGPPAIDAKSERACALAATEQPSAPAVEHLCRERAEVARAILMRRDAAK